MVCSPLTALGLGNCWLFTAQPLLHRIYEREAEVYGKYSAETGARTVVSDATNRAISPADHDDMSNAIEELMLDPEFLDARSVLVVATNFLSKAVELTSNSSAEYGPLLVEVGPSLVPKHRISPWR
jgi:hypothetical protein